MLARISAYFSCTEDELWQRIIEPRSLQYVSAPILGFAPAEPGLLDGSWQKERVYRLMLYLLKFIPLGHHSIQLVKISKKAHTISSRESSMLARVWNHNICFREITPGVVQYTDEIDIRAGWLTPIIWLFAQLFYRHRQRRWRRLLKQRPH